MFENTNAWNGASAEVCDATGADQGHAAGLINQIDKKQGKIFIENQSIAKVGCKILV